MRGIHVLAGVVGVAALGATPACTRDHATANDASSSAPAAESDPAEPVASTPAFVPPSIASTRVFLGGPAASAPASPTSPPAGAVVAGNACSPGRDSIACTADGIAVLTCASGQWRLLQSCKGPGRCAGVGSGLTCDTGMPEPGDPCVAATSEPRCRNSHEALACQGGAWMVTPCAQGHLCSPGGPKGHAGCK
jgi:hypothetical protein